MSELTYKTSAEAAAAWWAQQLGAPIHKMVRDEETGDDRFRADFAALAMMTLNAGRPMSSGQGEKFVAALVPTIETMLGRVNWVSLGVDYGPDHELAEAAEAAGIALSRFPWKTHMTLTKDYVTAALGYGSARNLIWTAPDWVRPPCGSQRFVESGDDWDCRDEVCSLPMFHDGDHGEWVADAKRCTECDGSYGDHFGRARKQARTHSWDPKAVA